MGLTVSSVGKGAIERQIVTNKKNIKTIALAGNPNVGKSTVFNKLTGMNQHTGNWPGKTVTNASGICKYKNKEYMLVDLPGTYSLMAHSKEEEIARDFICFSDLDATIIVCDATCLERNLNLVLQTLEITDNAIVCINLMDEAKKKGIKINFKKLENILNVPVIGVTASKNIGLDKLMENVKTMHKSNLKAYKVKYVKPIEEAINVIENAILQNINNKRFYALRILCNDIEFIEKMNIEKSEIEKAYQKAVKIIEENNIEINKVSDIVVRCIVISAEGIAQDVVKYESNTYRLRDKRIDDILTSKRFGIPVMLVLLCFIFWITITGANYPSDILFNFFFWFEEKIISFAKFIKIPVFLYEMLIYGLYRTVAWIVSVMLPPMAIFFPLFTLLEDLGYLPRVAFNMDNALKKCSACGKQSLTMC